jgi:lysophospholipase L1-like esterase
VRHPRFLLLLCVALAGALLARDPPPLPPGVPADYVGHLAPEPKGLLLKQGDRYAICGDSITEQKMYSRLIEAYLAAARPDLAVECRQYGWSGETAGGFAGRMKNDVLRFRPTIASTCYGMNDFRYVPFEKSIGEDFRKNQTKVVQAFKAAGARVVLGSSGTIHSVPPWVKSAKGTWETLNLALLQFRNIDIEVAEAEQVAFADVYWPMLAKGYETRAHYGETFKLEGGDGVHPGWAGHVMMAAAYLKALGLDGDLGTVDINLSDHSAKGSGGQRLVALDAGGLTLISDRIPGVFEAGDVAKDGTIAAGLALAEFNQRFNRLTLQVKGAQTAQVKVTWGGQSKVFARAALEAGVNLVAEFPQGPLKPAFDKIWKAVGDKQAYETKQIKSLFRSPEAKLDMEAVVQASELEHAKFVAALKAAYAPVETSLNVEEVR